MSRDFRLFPVISGYLRLFPVIPGYLRLFPVIPGYFRWGAEVLIFSPLFRATLPGTAGFWGRPGGPKFHAKAVPGRLGTADGPVLEVLSLLMFYSIFSPVFMVTLPGTAGCLCLPRGP